MKKHLYALTTVMTLLAGPAFAETIHIGVNGMVCAFCATGIEKSFKAKPETDKVTVSLEDKLVTIVTKDNTTMDDADIKKIIQDAGYDVASIHHQK